MQYTSRRRSGLTLPELMVAAAMSMVIMLIIAFAFREGINSFRKLRGVGQMQDRLRSAQNVLKRDLSSEHFGGLFQQGINGPYVRDQRLDIIGWKPPEEGYFEVRQGSPSVVEASDGDGVPSYFATDHSLRFTVKLTGKRQQDWFYAAGTGGGDVDFSNGSIQATRWAEVAYFLSPNGDNAKGTPLYTLYRVETPLNVGKPHPTTGVVLTPTSVARAANRNGGAAFGLAPTLDSSGNRTGDDILITDVLSFEVKVAWSNNTDPSMATVSPTFPTPTTAGSGNLDWPVANVSSQQGGRFDTGSTADVQAASPSYDWNNPASFNTTVSGAPRFRVRLSTVQIRIRVWDKATESARQITIVQDV